MNQIFTITRKELSQMLREKSFTLIVLLEIILVSASSFMSLGYIIFTSPESSGMLNQLGTLLYVGIVTDNKAEFGRAFGNQGLNFRFYDDFVLAKTDFKDGLLDAVVVGDIDYSDQPNSLEVYLASNSPKNSLTRIALKKALVSLEKNVRAVRVQSHAPDFELISYKILKYNPNARYIEIYYIFTLPLILFLPALVAGSLAIDSITQELEDKSILNLLTSPISSWKVLVGKNLAAVIAAIIQSVAWIFVLDYTAIDVMNIPELILLCFLYTLLFVNIGCIISLFFREMKASQIMYTLFSISAISLYSPFANMYNILSDNSPAFLLAQTSLGFSLVHNLPQLMILGFIVFVSTLLVLVYSKKLEKQL